jgi:membrane protein implicated in regulation of membrane protease activity
MLGAVAATITGLIAHFPYEETALAASIEPHQLLAFGTTLIFLLLLGWRWRSRCKRQDGTRSTASLIGLTLLIVTDLYGGHLVFQLGVGVFGLQ